MNSKKLDVKHNVRLRDCTTIKIGGFAADFFVAHDTGELNAILHAIKGPYYLLGGGSNILVQDAVSVKKPIIKLGDEFTYISSLDPKVYEVGAATPLSKLLGFAIKNNLGGLETLAGIPATVGGLIAMNASAFGKAISDSLVEAEVMERNGEIIRLKRKEITFGYRYSSLRGKAILRAWFRFDTCSNVRELIVTYLNTRKRTQDIKSFSCGCIFKNPVGFKAGFLIESCGFKGLRKNDAQVSERHANFIVNTGNACYGDVDFLIQNIKDKVFDTFKVELEEEVERWI